MNLEWGYILTEAAEGDACRPRGDDRVNGMRLHSQF
jgi:hypothetical protein